MLENTNPAPVAGNRMNALKEISTPLLSAEDTPDRLSLQAAIIGQRFALSPIRARLVCALAFGE